MQKAFLEFEKPFVALEARIAELEDVQREQGLDMSADLRDIRQTLTSMIRTKYSSLTAWETVQVSRHPDRPQTPDYIEAFVGDFKELHGDRHFSDDPAIITGLGKIGGEKVMLIGHRKGRDLKDKVACHFGCAHPEGYRKALLRMKLAEKFHLPVVTLIDTPGAYPGIGAEERGISQAIAENLMEMSRLRVPIISVIIGEGGSGGALGIGVADRLAILEFAYFSVISPEGCAAILWKTADRAEDAAKAMRLTSGELRELGLIDDIIPEPLGGAHRNAREMAITLQRRIVRYLREFRSVPSDELVENRYQKFRSIRPVIEAMAGDAAGSTSQDQSGQDA
ncbi:MAG: acetyl-CoA carboxylase carboxyltransferase subunit alpha [Phycisphaerae bacterium]|nr:acetyl-CoA carboxylase carboxyltransferase subunit alpha [Phycisphaerae bacterium]